MRDFQPKQPCVYLLASSPNGILYTGVTSALAQRVSLHKQKLVEGFTKRYGVTHLVYYAMHETMDAAIRRESQIKKWKRTWKVGLRKSKDDSLKPTWMAAFAAMTVVVRRPTNDADIDVLSILSSWPRRRPSTWTSTNRLSMFSLGVGWAVRYFAGRFVE